MTKHVLLARLVLAAFAALAAQVWMAQTIFVLPADIQAIPPFDGQPRPPRPARDGSLRSFRLDEESAYCDRSDRGRGENAHRCLVPSYPGGRRAAVRSVSDDEVRALLRGGAGDAFAMFPNLIGLHGRTFNNLGQIYSALVAARACGKLVLLPPGVKFPTDAEDWGCELLNASYFDCVDFRDAPVPTPFPQFDREEFCNISADLAKEEQIGRQIAPVDAEARGYGSLAELAAQEVGRYWHSMRGIDFPLPPSSYFDSVRLEAKRAVLAYWGMRPGSYQCQECGSEIPRQGMSAVVYVRSGDIFRNGTELSPYAKVKGQPPLDFFVQAIRHSGATHVILVCSDYKNPVVTALLNYNWITTGGESGAGSERHVDIEARVGDPYESVLRLVWCARVVIMSTTSMGPMVVFSPNAERVYMSRIIMAKGHKFAAYAREDTTAPLPPKSWRIPGAKYPSSLLASISDEVTVYGYVPIEKYTLYDGLWENTAEQREEMLNYRGGMIVRLS